MKNFLTRDTCILKVKVKDHQKSKDKVGTLMTNKDRELMCVLYKEL